MKTLILVILLFLLGIGLAIVIGYIDTVLDDKCNSNMIDIYIKILLTLCVSCIVFSISYFICKLNCSKYNDNITAPSSRIYLIISSLLCITICVIAALLQYELELVTCNFDKTTTLVLSIISGLIGLFSIGLFISSFYIKVSLDIQRVQPQQFQPQQFQPQQFQPPIKQPQQFQQPQGIELTDQRVHQRS
jgi:hypothetical protein